MSTRAAPSTTRPARRAALLVLVAGVAALGGCRSCKEPPPAATASPSTSDAALAEPATPRDTTTSQPRPEPLFDEFEPETAPEELTQVWDTVVLGKVRGKVLIRRRGEKDWSPAKAGMRLVEGDELSTATGATAAIRYGDGSVVQLAAGSAVVVRRSRTNADGARRVVSLFVGAGEVGLRSKPAGKTGATTFRLLTPSGMVRVGGERGAHEVSLRLDSGGVSLVRSRVGSALVVTRRGRQNLGPAETLSFRPAGDIVMSRGTRAPTEAPSAEGPEIPSPSGPVQREVDMKTRTVTLEWGGVPSAVRYSIELALDAAFSHTLLRENVATTRFEFDNQKEPKIFWRVRAVDERGRTSGFSNTYGINFVERERPTGRLFGEGRALQADGVTVGDATLRLEVTAPRNDAAFSEASIAVIGSAAPGSEIRVNNRRIEQQPDGTFTGSVQLELGINQVVVEARMPGGRLSHNTRNVFYKPKGLRAP